VPATIEVDEDLAIRNELERKYTDALANIVAKMENEEISAEAARVAFDAVYQTVSGLVSWRDLNVIMREAEAIVPDPQRTRFVLAKAAQVMSLEVRQTKLVIVHLKDNGQKAQVNNYLSQGDAFNEAERIMCNLVSRGWTEVL
jgi:hypothetical protein